MQQYFLRTKAWYEMNNVNNKLELRKKTILALSRAKGIGYYTIRKLYRAHKTLEDLSDYNLTDLIDLFSQAKIKYAERLAHDFFEDKKKLFEKAEIDYNNLVSERKIFFILDNESVFPQSLQDIPDRPFWLFVEGNLDILNSQNKVAVIGTRHPTYKGIAIAKQLTKYLVKKGYIIISGLAEGIDEAAHRVTNELKGKGIGVLGCGINLGFPARTIKIRNALISDGGTVISEYMMNDFYSRRSFVWRNRLQSGLSRVVFPIQGTLRSGTIHTIQFAEQQKRRVIGVFAKEIENVKQNELFYYLKERNYPIYDIASDLDKLLNAVEKPYEDLKPIKQQELFEIKDTEKKFRTEKKSLFRFIHRLLEKIRQ